MSTSTFEFMSYEAQNPGYQPGAAQRANLVLHWHTAGNVFTVDRIEVPSNGSWTWFRSDCIMYLLVGNDRYNILTMETAASNPPPPGYEAYVLDVVANRSLPKSFTITKNATSFGIWFGASRMPFPPSQGGGYTLQSPAKLRQVGGDQLSTIPIQVGYRPGKIKLGLWESCNRKAGSANIRTGGAWKETKSAEGGKAVAKSDLDTYLDGTQWRRQHKIGNNADN